MYFYGVNAVFKKVSFVRRRPAECWAETKESTDEIHGCPQAADRIPTKSRRERQPEQDWSLFSVLTKLRFGVQRFSHLHFKGDKSRAFHG